MGFKLIDKHVYLVEALDKYDINITEVVLASSMKEVVEILELLDPEWKILSVKYICRIAYESEEA